MPVALPVPEVDKACSTLYIQDISNSTHPFWKLYFPHLVPYTGISPSPHLQKKPLCPFPGFFISLNCTVIHPVSCSCQKPKSLPSIHSSFSHCTLPAYKQILSILSSKHTPNAFTSFPLYYLLCNPSHHHLSHGILQPLPMTSSSHSSQSSTFF